MMGENSHFILPSTNEGTTTASDMQNLPATIARHISIKHVSERMAVVHFN